MAKVILPLSAAAVKALTKAPCKQQRVIAVGGVAGLYLHVKKSCTASWILRVVVGAVRREYGLGSYPEISLAQAREKAQEQRSRIDNGTAPPPRAAGVRRPKRLTLSQCFADFIKSRGAEFKNPKHLAQWHSTWRDYVDPVIGAKAVAEINTDDVLAVLQPIWTEKTETATRVRQRLEKVLDWAKVMNHRAGDNPARWQGHLSETLPKPSKIARAKNHAALDWRDMPAFWSRLVELRSSSALCLQWTILTACRSGEARAATWAEINLDDGLWVIPAARMKAGREHAVVLSSCAIALLKKLPRFEGCDLLFPSPKSAALSDVAVAKTLKQLAAEVTTHGFRASFRTWAAEATDHHAELAEMALAHQAGKLTRTYQRGGLIEKRRELAEDWCRYIKREKTAG